MRFARPKLPSKVACGVLTLLLCFPADRATGADSNEDLRTQVAQLTEKCSELQGKQQELVAQNGALNEDKRELLDVIDSTLPVLQAKIKELQERIVAEELAQGRMDLEIERQRDALAEANAEAEKAKSTYMGYISDLPLIKAQTDWGEVEKNRSVDWSRAPGGANSHQRICGQEYSKGLGTNASSDIVFDTHGFAREFHCVCGLDDTAFSKGNKRPVTADFIVNGLIGGTWYQLATVRVTSGQNPQPIELTRLDDGYAQGTVTQLELVTAAVGGSNRFEHTDWAMARISR